MIIRFSRWFRLSITFYVCVCLIGCTPAAYKQAQAYANREPKYWTIEDVTFAALRDKRFIRMCVKLKYFSEEVITEIELDINEIVDQLRDEHKTVVSFEEGAELEYSYYHDDEKISGKNYAKCNAVLQKNETELQIVYESTNNDNIESAILDIDQESLESPSLFLIEHEDSRYLIFGAPLNLYPELSKYAFRCYAEDQKEPGRYLIVPVAVVGDAIMVIGTVFVIGICIVLLPLCIIAMISSDKERIKGYYWYSIEQGKSPIAFPLPPPTAKPECD